MNKRDYLNYYQLYTKRLDGRESLEFRKISVKKDIIKTAEGSAIASLGETVVIAGIKFEYGELFEKNKGNFVVNFEFSTLADKQIVSSAPSPESIEISRVIDRGFRSAEVIDLEKLAPEEDKGYTLFLDLYLLNDDGNIIDTCYIAGMAALMNVKIPKYEDGNLIRTEFLNIDVVKNIVTPSSFAKLEFLNFLDPDKFEDRISDSKLHIAVDDKHIVSIQKSGNASYREKEILDLIDVTFKNRSLILKHLR
jgi:exosome complex component RRP42